MKLNIVSQSTDSGFMDVIKKLTLEDGTEINAQYMADFIGYSVTKGNEILDEMVTDTDDKERYNGEWGEYYKYLDDMIPETDEDEDW
ncbi:MAG: hypothetical protein Q4C42_02240 [Clostridia bacterium]|nr:hypothetical protein [Clostridia bacterium]